MKQVQKVNAEYLKWLNLLELKNKYRLLLNDEYLVLQNGQSSM